MVLPEALRASLDAALSAAGHAPVESVQAISGGCIAETARLRAADGAPFFLKWTRGGHPVGLFDEEAAALAALAATRTLRVPRVIDVCDAVAAGDAAPRWLLLEWLEPGAPDARTWTRLGAGLAAMHRARGDRFGWPRDNFIGSLPQANSVADSWAGFWADRRLRPQLELALAGGWFGRAEATRFEALFRSLDEIVGAATEDGPSLLHGDLWSGNLHTLASSEPALIDPASYFGHREVDLAMTELFGGFDDAFRRAYRAEWPLAPGYERRRRPVYQLYYLLVHVNLFGGSYRAGTLAALRDAGF